MLITDLNAETMANLAHNIELNRDRYSAGSEVRARCALGRTQQSDFALVTFAPVKSESTASETDGWNLLTLRRARLHWRNELLRRDALATVSWYYL